MKSIVKFHIGRGGRFYNGGHLSFLGFEGLNEHDIQNCFLNMETKEFEDGQGNSVGLTEGEYESGIGTVDHDGEYNSTYAKYLGDCTEKEIFLIVKDSEDYIDTIVEETNYSRGCILDFY